MNCGYGRGFSVLEVLDAVDRVTNMKIERRMESRRAGDPDALVADNGKILSTLAWRPKLDDLDTIVAARAGVGEEAGGARLKLLPPFSGGGGTAANKCSPGFREGIRGAR